MAVEIEVFRGVGGGVGGRGGQTPAERLEMIIAEFGGFGEHSGVEHWRV